jgi:cyclic pyranopterin phosphate synthase
MPEEDVAWKPRQEILSFEEILRAAAVAVGMGIRKIRVTGGEPLLRSNVESLLADMRAIPGLTSLGVTTNGVLLSRKLPLIRSSVDHLNISLDTFRSDRFRDLLDDVLAGIEDALAAGYRDLKINAVVMRGINDDEILDFVRFVAERPVAVRFIEFMPFAGNGWSDEHVVPMQEILSRIEADYELERIPDGPSPISRDYRLTERSGGRRLLGSVGVIASMSQPFCDSCSRLRLTAEGMIMPCLHSPLEFDLRALLRSGGSDHDIRDLFLEAVGSKPKEHPGPDELIDQARRVMIQIGG